MFRLVHLTTLPQTAASFLHGQLSWLRQQGFDITLVSSPGVQLAEFAAREGVQWRALEMTRSIAPAADTRAIGKLAAYLRRLRPHLVHAHTPKAGLVGMAAATLAGVPVRVYQLHGLRFETARGYRRRLLKAIERLTCRLAHRVICVSPSLKARGLQEGLYEESHATVLQHGSANGLDVDAFLGQDDVAALRAHTRRRLGIPLDAVCVGFVGRLVRDKGVLELAAAWQRLRAEFPRLHLLLVGPFEAHDAIPRSVQQQLQTDERVHLTGLDWQTRGYYAAMDVFTLPSHREGLGHVLLEAGAMELPVVSCRVTGCVDAVVPEVTGILVPPGDSPSLAAGIARYVRDPQLCRRHGQAGRRWVKSRFAPEPIWHAVYEEYQRLLESHRYA
jgi:glycosyltransferase involved in cell wall biosynthesis